MQAEIRRWKTAPAPMVPHERQERHPAERDDSIATGLAISFESLLNRFLGGVGRATVEDGHIATSEFAHYRVELIDETCRSDAP